MQKGISDNYVKHSDCKAVDYMTFIRKRKPE